MESELAQQRQALEAAAAKAGGDGKGASDGGDAGSGGAAKESRDWLAYSVKLLAGLPAESLGKLQAAPKKVAVYRCVALVRCAIARTNNAAQPERNPKRNLHSSCVCAGRCVPSGSWSSRMRT